MVIISTSLKRWYFFFWVVGCVPGYCGLCRNDGLFSVSWLLRWREVSKKPIYLTCRLIWFRCFCWSLLKVLISSHLVCHFSSFFGLFFSQPFRDFHFYLRLWRLLISAGPHFSFLHKCNSCFLHQRVTLDVSKLVWAIVNLSQYGAGRTRAFTRKLFSFHLFFPTASTFQASDDCLCPLVLWFAHSPRSWWPFGQPVPIFEKIQSRIIYLF